MNAIVEVPLEEAAAGQLLAADLCDAGGTVLLPRGTALTESMLGALARRGVDSVAIVVEQSNAEQEAEREALRQQRLARLDRLFRQHGDAAASPLFASLQHYRRSQ